MGEDATQITIAGSGFLAGATIGLSIRRAATAITAPLTADDSGAFSHTVTDVVASPAGATVLATADDGDLATGRLTSFVPAALG